MNLDDMELTLLSMDELSGLHGGKQLDVLKKYGIGSAFTDFVILTGGDMDDTYACMAPDDYSLKGRTGLFYTRTTEKDGTYPSIYGNGSRSSASGGPDGAIRPVLLSPSVYSQISSKRMSGFNGTEEVEFGEFPQYAPDFDMQRRLEREYKRGSLIKTGKSYTYDRPRTSDDNHMWQTEKYYKYDEYEYNGKKYIRVKAFSKYGKRERFELSNGKKYRNGDNVWIEVSPIVWLIDDSTKTLISKRCLMAGIRYSKKGQWTKDFSALSVKEYLDNYMLPELTQTTALTRVQDNQDTKLYFQDKNPKIYDMKPFIKDMVFINDDVTPKEKKQLNKINSQIQKRNNIYVNVIVNETGNIYIPIDNYSLIFGRNTNIIDVDGTVEITMDELTDILSIAQITWFIKSQDNIREIDLSMLKNKRVDAKTYIRTIMDLIKKDDKSLKK